VVRDIYGTFEAIIDRLLKEKKGDVIRKMVNDLMTEDLKKTIAAGREDLQKEELNNMGEELRQLKSDFQTREAAWEEKFEVTIELKKSQEELWSTLDERCKALETRANAVETDFAQKKELDARMDAVFQEFDSMRDTVSKASTTVEDFVARFEALEKTCRETYVTTAMLEEALGKANMALEAAKEEQKKAEQQMREDLASKVDLQKVADVAKDKLNELHDELKATSEALTQLKTHVEASERAAAENFSTKKELEASQQAQSETIGSSINEIKKHCSHLEETCATKESLEAETTKRNGEAAKNEEKDARISESLASAGKRLEDLEVFLNDSKEKQWATQQDVDEIAKKHSAAAAEDVNCKAELKQLEDDLETERQRLQQLMRHQQTSHQELTQLTELLHKMKQQATDTVHVLHEAQDKIDENAKKGEASTKALEGRTEALEATSNELHANLEALSGDLANYMEYNRAEGERLREHSTHCYLEQIDKALHLNNSLGKLRGDHDELKEKVIKLPPLVSSNQNSGLPALPPPARSGSHGSNNSGGGGGGGFAVANNNSSNNSNNASNGTPAMVLDGCEPSRPPHQGTDPTSTTSTVGQPDSDIKNPTRDGTQADDPQASSDRNPEPKPQEGPPLQGPMDIADAQHRG